MNDWFFHLINSVAGSSMALDVSSATRESYLTEALGIVRC